MPLKMLYCVRKTAQGWSQKEIDRALGLQKSAHDYLSRFAKLTGVRGRPAVTAFALKAGLLACWMLCVTANAQPVPAAREDARPTTTDKELIWDAVPAATSYRVFLGTNRGDYYQNQTVTTNYAKWPGLSKGTVYYTAVKSQNGMEESAYSAEYVYWLVDTVLNIAVHTVRLDWTATGRTNILQQRTSATGSWANVFTTTQSGPVTVIRTNQGNQAYYRVQVKP